MELRSRVAVVTGASSGIGEAVARRLAGEGMTVVAVARRAERLGALAAAHEGVEAYPADVTSDEQVDTLADYVRERHGACHLLVNNAGIGSSAGVEAVPDREVIREVMESNFFSVVRCMTAFADLLAESAPAQVVNVASVAGKIGVGGGAYSASKFALVGLSEAAAARWRRRGVIVTQLNPGFVVTEGFPQRGLRRSPLTRWLLTTPEAVADALVDAVRKGRHERTVPRWYRIFVFARHAAGALFWAGLRRSAI